MFRIFQKLGGEAEALEIVAKSRGGPVRGGDRPSHWTLRNWRLAGRLPSTVAMVLMTECQTRGITCEPSDCEWSGADENNAASASQAEKVA